ncbi:MAG: GAF domain-containing protein, partial [Chloroflexi bacterium]|nr:GAF domain-containing protein [Chloroflexota bacterium]
QREARQQQELSVLNELGRIINNRAALDDLEGLLLEVRDQIGRLINVSNFQVVLVDEDTNCLEVCLQFQDGRRCKDHHRHDIETGLIGHLISGNRRLFLPCGTRDYRLEYQIPLLGTAARSWMGVSLVMEGHAIGAIVMENDSRREAYNREDFRLLCVVADQITGVIQSARLKEKESVARRQLSILHQASETIMKLAEENEDWLWHATLTVATAEYALGFNRAMLLMLNENRTRLSGYMGIGHLNTANARSDWEIDKEAQLTFADYLQQLSAGMLKTTSLQTAVKQFTLPLDQAQGSFQDVIDNGKRQIAPVSQAQQSLPDIFVQTFGEADYAILPLRSSKQIEGIAILDNIHNQEPLSAAALDYLEPLLAQAVLVWRILQEQRTRDQLIDLNYHVMAQVPEQPLSRTLQEICWAAQSFTGADFVIINPLKPDGGPLEFDPATIHGVNKARESIHVPRPRSEGITVHILRAGTVVMPNINQDETLYGGERLADSEYMQVNDINALIGMPIRDLNTGDPLGVLYLKYHHPHSFSDKVVQHARLFANLTAVAVQNSWATRRPRVRAGLVRDHHDDDKRHLKILSNVLEESLVADQDESKVIKALLRAAADLIHKPDAQISLILRAWIEGNEPPVTRKEIRYKYTLNVVGKVVTSTEGYIYQGISGQVIRDGKVRLVSDVRQQPWSKHFLPGFQYMDTRSELVVPLVSGDQVIGVLNIESPHVGAFYDADKVAWQRLAAAAGLALGNVRRKKHLHMVLSATQAMMAPTQLQETLVSIATQIRNAAPNLSVLTIWYKLPGSEQLKLGHHYGVHNHNLLKETIDLQDTNSAIWHIMNSHKPIWAPRIEDDLRLVGRFVLEEQIKSSAAFPLQSDNEVVGAMILNYREYHEFSGEEKDVLTVLAQVVAASVRDAAHLEVVHKERQRLEASLEIAEAVGQTLDLDTALGKVLRKLMDLFPNAKPVVLIYDAAHQRLAFAPASFEFYPLTTSQYAQIRHLRVGENCDSLVGTAAQMSLNSREMEVLNVGDVSKYSQYMEVVSDTKSQLSVTLMNDGRLLGVFALESPILNAFEEIDLAFIRGVGHQISVALDRAHRSGQLRFRTMVAGMMAWAAEIAHDINRELGYIRNRTYWILEENDASDSRRRSWAHEIDDSVERLVEAMPVGAGLRRVAEKDSFLLAGCRKSGF